MQMGKGESIISRFCFGNFRLNGAQFPIAIQDVVESGPLNGGRLLGNKGNLQPGGQSKVPGVRVQRPHDEFEKAGFPCSIGPGDAYPVALVQGEGGLLEKNSCSASQGD